LGFGHEDDNCDYYHIESHYFGQQYVDGGPGPIFEKEEREYSHTGVDGWDEASQGPDVYLMYQAPISGTGHGFYRGFRSLANMEDADFVAVTMSGIWLGPSCVYLS
jgi:hypothetical protein